MQLVLKTTPTFDNGVAPRCHKLYWLCIVAAHKEPLRCQRYSTHHTLHYQKDVSFPELLYLSAPLGTLQKP